MAERVRVLVVDDEEPLAEVVASYLRREGFAVDVAHDGPTAVASAQGLAPDLVVLDVMLPGFDGVEVCRRIRGFSDCYIIMLTARAEEIDKVVGLSVGADDYIVKPFSPRELLARVQAMLRRPRAPEPAPPSSGPVEGLITFGELSIDVLARRASVAGVPLELTRTEFDLLATLAANPRQAFTRRQLIDAVWGESWYGDEHIVDVHVGHLRRKLDDDAADPQYLRTVRGVGYGMVA
jgi:DNA-binding response OmpR family regulator